MARKKISYSRQIRSQEAQIRRITNMVNTMQQQGFTFSKTFLNSLRVTGRSSAKAAKQKAVKLRGIKKTDLYSKVTQYRTDEGKKITGPDAGRMGKLAEQRKRRREKKERLNALDDVEDALNGITDHIHPGGSWIDLSKEKSELMNAWQNYRNNVTAETYDKNMLSAIRNLADGMIYPSDSYDHWDGSRQKIYNILTGVPMPEYAISTDEDI